MNAAAIPDSAAGSSTRTTVSNRVAPSPYEASRSERGTANPLSGRLREVAFDQDPVAQLVIDTQGMVALANVRARELFRLTSSDIGRPLQDLEVSYRPVELRSCVDDANQRRQVVQVRETSWPGAGGEPRYFNVQVMPLLDSNDASIGTKILFVDVTRQHDDIKVERFAHPPDSLRLSMYFHNGKSSHPRPEHDYHHSDNANRGANQIGGCRSNGVHQP